MFEWIKDYWGLIVHYSGIYELDPNMLGAIVMKESYDTGLDKCDTFAVRLEPKFNYFTKVKEWAKIVSVSYSTEEVCQRMSWGLTQVMGATARELGLQSDIPNMLRPEVGIEYGAKYLRKQLSRYKGDYKDAVAAYNAGSAKKNCSGRYNNQSYVDAVYNYYYNIKDKQ